MDNLLEGKSADNSAPSPRGGDGAAGIRLNFDIRPGASNEVPILICNGLGVGLRTLAPLVNALAGPTLITFDAPGIGDSPTPLRPYSFTKLAGMLDSELARLGIGEVDVVGISWGGLLAQEFALKYPSRCRKLILAATTMGVVSVPGNIYLQSMFSSPLIFWWKRGLLNQLASQVYGGDLRRKGSKYRLYLDINKEDLPGYFLQLLAMTCWTSFPRLRKLQQSTLLLAGRDDPVVPMINAVMMKKLIPTAKLLTFDCGHLFPFTRADRVAAEIHKFRS